MRDLYYRVSGGGENLGCRTTALCIMLYMRIDSARGRDGVSVFLIYFLGDRNVNRPLPAYLFSLHSSRAGGCVCVCFISGTLYGISCFDRSSVHYRTDGN